MKKEIWKPIVGYEELYEVSNLGRVKSMNYNHTGKEQVLKPNKTRYLTVILSKNGNSDCKGVHILVAEAFIPNPEKKQEVHHIDKDPFNNRVDNLMWVTPNEHRSIYHCDNVSNLCKHTSKMVYQYSMGGELLAEYCSCAEAARQNNFSQGNISDACRGKYKTLYGFQWSYEKHDNIKLVEPLEKRRWKHRSKTVLQYSLDGNFIKEYKSAKDAAIQTGIEVSNIRSCCRGLYKKTHGFIFRYKDAV